MNLLKQLISKRKFTLVIILMIALCLVFIINVRNLSKEASKIQTGIVVTDVLSSPLIPISIKIPNIDIDTKVEVVGLTSSGIVDSPILPANVAWFNGSPIPGDIGNSVIDGHSGWKDNAPAVFDNLYKIKIGSKIYIENGSGDVTIFIVRELKTYKSNEIVPSIFVSSDNKSHLNLITCSGIWSELESSHSSRLVVFTDKE